MIATTLDQMRTMWERRFSPGYIGRAAQPTLTAHDVKALARQHGWTRNTSAPRPYPCVDCGAPNTATRPNSRCPTDSALHEAAMRRAGAEKDKARDAARYAAKCAKRDRDAKRVPQDTDPDIQVYRAEKAKRAARKQAETEAVIAHAKKLLNIEHAA